MTDHGRSPEATSIADTAARALGVSGGQQVVCYPSWTRTRWGRCLLLLPLSGLFLWLTAALGGAERTMALLSFLLIWMSPLLLWLAVDYARHVSADAEGIRVGNPRPSRLIPWSEITDSLWVNSGYVLRTSRGEVRLGASTDARRIERAVRETFHIGRGPEVTCSSAALSRIPPEDPAELGLSRADDVG